MWLFLSPPVVGGVKVKDRTSEWRMKVGGVKGGGRWFFDGSWCGHQSALKPFYQLLTARGTSGRRATVPSEGERRLWACIWQHVYAFEKSPHSSFVLQPNQNISVSLSCCSYISIRVWIKLRGWHTSQLQASLPMHACLFTQNRAESAFHESWISESVSLRVVAHYFLSLSSLSFIYGSYRALLCSTWHLIHTTRPADNLWNSVGLG